MYRIVTDFHGGWYGWGGLQQAIFIAGNFTAAGLNGKNGTFPDNDMLPLSAKWWSKAGGAGGGGKGWTPEEAARGQTIMTLDIISRSPLMHAGTLLKATKPDNSPAPLLSDRPNHSPAPLLSDRTNHSPAPLLSDRTNHT